MSNIIIDNDKIEQSRKQLEEIRLLKSLKYNKKIEQECLEKNKQEQEHYRLEKIKQEYLEKEKLEEIRLYNERQVKLKADELISKEHQEYLDRISNEENKGIKDSYTECLCPENETIIPMNHSDILNDSLVIILSIFENTMNSFLNDPQSFIQNLIINPFYQQINNTSIDNLYTFYISIKEMSSTFDDIDIELVFNTLSLINMNNHFAKVLNNSNKLEYIKIIFQEFIKIIDYIKPEFNHST